jgi:hypothetical protein
MDNCGEGSVKSIGVLDCTEISYHDIISAAVKQPSNVDNA